MNEFRDEVSYMLDQDFSPREIAMITGHDENYIHSIVHEVNAQYYDDTIEGNVYYDYFA